MITKLLSGLLDQSVSWLYYPEGALKMRLIGQLILTKVAETSILNGWKVISLNTDGQSVIIPRKEYDKYKKVMKEIENRFNIELEHETFNFMYFTHINGYISQTSSGKAKRKGFYQLKEELDLGDSVNQLIIPFAISNYFLNNIPIEHTITHPKEYNLSILDYCKSNKISKKDYDVIWNEQKIQNLNRYYFAKNSPFLFKKRKTSSLKYKGKSNLEHINSGWGVQIYNEHIIKPFEEYNVNFKYYVSKCNEIINDLQKDKRQLSLW